MQECSGVAGQEPEHTTGDQTQEPKTVLVSDWGFIGGTYAGQAADVNAERCINLYPEVTETQGQRSKRRVVLYSRPGLVLWATAGSGPIRAAFYQDGRMFVVSGVEFYEVSAGAVATLRGAVVSDSNPATISSNGPGGNQLFVVSAGSGYVYDLVGNTLTLITDVDFPTVAVMGDFSDAYFLVLKDDSTQFNFSALNNGSSWPTASFATKSQSSDYVRALLVDHKEVWLFGSKATEVWYNTGDGTNPFAPIQGVLIEHGIHAPWSATRVNNTICWIGEDAGGFGTAWLANGYTPQRFSTHGVEQMWRSYGVSLEDAVGYAYQEDGHTFYVVSFLGANHTWAYDFASGMWHELGYWDGSDFDAHLGRCHVYAHGAHRLGSRIDGKIYTQSLSIYDDDGTVLRRLRRSPHMHADERRIEYRSAELDLRRGAGLQSGQGSNPQLMLRWSNDGGYTWSNEHFVSAGIYQSYDVRAVWRRLGQARHRVYEVVMTDPVPMAWIDMILDVEALDG